MPEDKDKPMMEPERPKETPKESKVKKPKFTVNEQMKPIQGLVLSDDDKSFRVLYLDGDKLVMGNEIPVTELTALPFRHAHEGIRTLVTHAQIEDYRKETK
jgi:hypothetical protein